MKFIETISFVSLVDTHLEMNLPVARPLRRGLPSRSVKDNSRQYKQLGRLYQGKLVTYTQIPQRMDISSQMR